MNNHILSVTDAVLASNAKCDCIISTLDNIIERMEKQVYLWKTEASWVDIQKIIDDIKRGKFCEADTTTTEYYNDDKIQVIASVDRDLYPISLDVFLIDENGDEYPLCDKQYNAIQKMWKDVLQETAEDARSEEEFVKYLWSKC